MVSQCRIITIMKIIVGLGNPGDKYVENRHNVGQMVVDRIQGAESREQGAGSRFLKLETFMNKSGEAIKKALDFYKLTPSDLILVHDDLDIRLGDFKIEVGRGPKQHNGVISVEEELGTKDFLRVRVGVDNRDQRTEIREPGDKYVLADFSNDEKKVLDGVIEKILEELKTRHEID